MSDRKPDENEKKAKEVAAKTGDETQKVNTNEKKTKRDNTSKESIQTGAKNQSQEATQKVDTNEKKTKGDKTSKESIQTGAKNQSQEATQKVDTNGNKSKKGVNPSKTSLPQNASTNTNLVHNHTLCQPGGSPPGFQYLLSVNQLLIKHKIELFEVMTGFEKQNRYVIQNTFGQTVFKAKEVSGFCDRCCLSQIRPFDMEIMDNNNSEVIHLRRPLRCITTLCFCCLQEMDVEAPKGNVIGRIVQDCSWWYPILHIENSMNETVFTIRGPLCPCSLFCNDVHFDIFGHKPNVKIGKISKLWTGCCRETFTDSDVFSVIFPLDLEITMKALLLSAAFLIDYMFFEN